MGRWIKGVNQWMGVLGVGEVRGITVRVVDVSSHGSGYPPPSSRGRHGSMPILRCRGRMNPRMLLSRVAN